MDDINPLDFFSKPKEKVPSPAKLEENTIEIQNLFEHVDPKMVKIRVKNGDNFWKMNSFADKNLINNKILTNLEENKYKKPSLIQSYGIPLILQGRNIFGVAPTGSGKSASFIIPIINRIITKKFKKKKVRAIIIVPTRELIFQICAEVEKISFKTGLVVQNIDEFDEKNQCDILVSTPFSLYSLLQKKDIQFKKLKIMVIDEADKLLNKEIKIKNNTKNITENNQKNNTKNTSKNNTKNNTKNTQTNTSKNNTKNTSNRIKLEKQIELIISRCENKKLQKAFFSATLPSHIESAAKSFMKNPVVLLIGSREAPSSLVDQSLKFVGSDSGKLFSLKQIFNQSFSPPILIFVQTKARAKQLLNEIKDEYPKSAALTSDVNQNNRDKILSNFKKSKIDILICSNLVSRGIDFKEVNLVINFDFPTTVNEYIHRVGRAGRAGKRGKAVTFFTKNDRLLLRNVAVVIKESGGIVPDWIFGLQKVNRSRRKHLKQIPPKRKKIRAINLIKN